MENNSTVLDFFMFYFFLRRLILCLAGTQEKNNRMLWVGRGLWRSSSSRPLLCAGTSFTRLGCSNPVQADLEEFAAAMKLQSTQGREKGQGYQKTEKGYLLLESVSMILLNILNSILQEVAKLKLMMWNCYHVLKWRVCSRKEEIWRKY